MKRLILLATLLTPMIASAEALKDVFAHDFLIGAALNRDQFEGRDEKADAIVRSQFDTITSENNMKWGPTHPEPDRYDFSHADAFAAFGEANHMVLIGHNLVWHQNTPAWVFQDAQGKPLTRDALLARLRDHIHTVVGRYKGRIKGWDVVNEAINMDGSMRESPWYRIIGPDYVEQAFRFAHEADPAAELYYNDYPLEVPAKRKGALALIKRLPAAAKPDTELVQTDKNDPALDPYRDRLPDAVQQELARRYADLFRVYLSHPGTITRVTFWNVTDAESWLNHFPVMGRTNYPTLFGRDGKPKPAYDAVVKVKDAAK